MSVSRLDVKNARSSRTHVMFGVLLTDRHTDGRSAVCICMHLSGCIVFVVLTGLCDTMLASTATR